MQQLSWFDHIISNYQELLQRHAAMQPTSALPTKSRAHQTTLTHEERQLSMRLMRVNHAGEVAAQGLLRGQALIAQDPKIKKALLQAADEEQNHLTWCHARVDELGGKTSALQPLWYWGSVLIGLLSGLAGDKTSLGFVKETEQQVSKHLADHLKRLPKDDEISRAIVSKMQAEECAHIEWATKLGATELPAIFRFWMHFTGRLMTTSAYWF